MQQSKLPAVLLCALTLACKRPDPIRLQPTIEKEAALSPIVRIGDPVSEGQLMRGFYELEGTSWRWAASRFNVELGIPPEAPKRGAVLVLNLTLPEPTIAALKSVTVTGKVARTPLPPETFTTAGAHEYRRDVPAEAFTRDAVDAEFSVDKFLKPVGDGRELAIIVHSIELEPK